MATSFFSIDSQIYAEKNESTQEKSVEAKMSVMAVTTLPTAVSSKVTGVTTNLNVRKGPGTSYAVINKLKNGASLSVTGYSGNWLKMKTSSISTGYVSKKYVNVPVVSVKMASTASVINGKTVTVKGTVYPACATNTKVTYSSSNTGVATVNASGVVTGKKVGSATITAKSSSGGKTAKCKVTVKPAPVASVALNRTTLAMTLGGSSTITATISPSNAANKAVTWSSSNTGVATVSCGRITAVNVGTATITVRTTDGGKTATCRVTVSPVNVTSVRLNKASSVLSVGETEKLTPTIAPANATNKNVTWSSDNTSVATVDSGGNIKGISNGVATITVRTVDGGKAATCKITITNNRVQSISLNKTTMSIQSESSEVLTASVSPENAADRSVTWTTDNGDIAKVDGNGKVTGYKPGTTNITVISNDGNKRATCKVTVMPIVVTSISLDRVSAAILVGQKLKLNATVLPANATNKNVTWSSSATQIATVDTNGNITAKVPGTAIISAKTVDGGKIATASIKVNPIPVTGVKLNKVNLEIYKGATSALSPTITPANATYKSVTWATSNSKVATVVGGKVKGVGHGVVTITVTTTDGKKKATCKVVVVAKLKKAKTGWVKASYTNEYTGPATTYTKKKTLSKDGQITIVGKAGTWYKLSNNLFVKSSDITFTKPKGGSYSKNQIKALQIEFRDKLKKRGGDYDGVNGLQCVDLTCWFIKEKCKGLTYGNGNGIAVVKNLISKNKSKLKSESSDKPPRAPAIFSTKSKKYGASGRDAGHTGIVVAVNGKELTIIHTYNKLKTFSMRSKSFTVIWNDKDSVKFTYVGKYLK